MSAYTFRFWGLLATGWTLAASTQLLLGMTSGADWWKAMALMPFGLGCLLAVGSLAQVLGYHWSLKKPCPRGLWRGGP